jgi:signal transduction histidine kinase
MDDEFNRLSKLSGAQLAREIQSLRKKQREVKQASEEWVAVVAHDMRQPLATIQLSDELLGKLSPDEEGAKALRRITLSTRRLLRMVEDLTDVSLFESGRLRIHPEKVVVFEVVRDVVDELAPLLRGRELILETPEDLPALYADPERLMQILGNLLSNAVKYGHPERPIRISAVPCEDGVAIAVANEGTSLTKEEIGRMFSRFYRASSQNRSDVRGLGLGLYIARGLVESHGGRIRVTSENGVTTFQFTLPTLLTKASHG